MRLSLSVEMQIDTIQPGGKNGFSSLKELE